MRFFSKEKTPQEIKCNKPRKSTQWRVVSKQENVNLSVRISPWQMVGESFLGW